VCLQRFHGIVQVALTEDATPARGRSTELALPAVVGTGSRHPEAPNCVRPFARHATRVVFRGSDPQEVPR
jgi:hypothetical protein